MSNHSCYAFDLPGKRNRSDSSCQCHYCVNNLFRHVALMNTSRLCPTIHPALVNAYCKPSSLFVGGECIVFKGTTQGDPLAMAIYVLATVPLIKTIYTEASHQIWYEDDAVNSGNLASINMWWNKLT